MSILDDAIREHLELKRAHGADEAELKRLEDEAFGPPGRPEEPDPFAEAPTEFMEAETGQGAEAAEETGGRRINIADLQEPPPPEAAPPAEAAEPSEDAQVEAVETVEPAAEEAPIVPAEDAAQAAPPAEEPLVADEAEARAGEHQAVAEQPTELFDVEAEMGTEDVPAAEIQASRSTAAEEEPLAEEDEEDEEFWSDQRLSDELDQALEAPPATEPPPIAEAAPLPEAPLTDEEEIPPAAAAPSPPLGEEGEDQQRPDFDPDTGHEDVLEDTPEFLEDAPEDDELWFEQRPPKDFDFDD